MHVVATAGHVDHGKSTLVRALTGMEPDRWAEERRRGMTIDLGYAWTALPSGAQVAFVDVPGHQRFIGNMLAGLGPAPAVLMVVAADEGWRRQSAEHLAAVDALGIRQGLLAVTRSDLADPRPALAEAQDHIRRSSLGTVDSVVVSGATGRGLADLRSALDRLVGQLPPPVIDGRVRLWIDRVFTIRGSGTVVTGTLGAGSLTAGEELELDGRRLRVRGLHRLGEAVERVDAVARVAVNLRSVAVDDISRGDVLATPGGWRPTRFADVRLTTAATDLPAELVLHIGSAAVPVRLRPLGGLTARLTAARPLPLQVGDRAVLRDPGQQLVAAGVLVLDADPPALSRRGSAARRAQVLLAATGRPDVTAEVTRRGAVQRVNLETLGILSRDVIPDVSAVREVEGWLVAEPRWRSWSAALVEAVDAHARAHPLEPRMPLEAARRSVDVPDARVIPQLARDSGLQVGAGRVSRPGVRARLGAAETGIAELEARLAVEPFAAPERGELVARGLGARELAAAVAAGRLLRLGDEVVLLPSGPARAMRVLAGLSQPFSVSDARQALGTTRRVAVPLLEHLDARGWTVRDDTSRRRVV
jgi:selenocysteine-specific elongation factor